MVRASPTSTLFLSLSFSDGSWDLFNFEPDPEILAAARGVFPPMFDADATPATPPPPPRRIVKATVETKSTRGKLWEEEECKREISDNKSELL